MEPREAGLMSPLVITLILSIIFAAAPDGITKTCLSFEPAVDSIIGTLVRKTFPGPPNYESVQAGDQAETGWYVTLAQPVCFAGTSTNGPNSRDIAAVHLVQLVLTHGEYKSHAGLVGKHVKVTGTFFAAQTGHHHAPVLVQVRTLERAR
jgi:hypothetical protein